MKGCFEVLGKVTWTDSLSPMPGPWSQGVRWGFIGASDPVQVKSLSVHHAHQVHGTEVVVASEATTGPATDNRQSADGVWTEDPLTVSVKTADCLPLLLMRQAGGSGSDKVAALHAGWRGLAAGIVGSGLAVMAATSDLSRVAAVIGPAICSDHFEIGPEVVEAFTQGAIDLSPQQLGRCLRKGESDRWHLDLTSAAAFALVNRGVRAENILAHRICTFCDQRWFSYRRQRQLRGGSNWSWIKLDSNPGS